MTKATSSPGPGMATDSSGHAVIDPTKNVLDLVDASVQRLNDLNTLQVQRLDDLRDSESHHVREITHLKAEHMKEVSAIRADYEAKLSVKESTRIDAIRAVDVAANLADRQAAETRANTLAATVAGSAEAMRVQVAASASAATDNLDRRLDPIQKSIEEIRRFQYEAQGQKTQVTETQSKSSNVGMWFGVGIAALIGTVSLILGIVDVMLKLSS